MDTKATLLLGVALAGILVVATLSDNAPTKEDNVQDKPKVEPKKVVL